MDHNDLVFEPQLEEVVDQILAKSDKDRILTFQNHAGNFHFASSNIYTLDLRRQQQIFQQNFAKIINKKLQKKAMNPLVNVLIFKQFYNLTTFSIIQPQCKLITFLFFEDCPLGDKGVECIHNAQWKFIKHLILSKNMISHEGAALISKCKWKFLNQLIINSNPIENKGFECLIKGDWPSLTTFQLIEAGLTPDCVKLVAKIPWASLRSLNLYQSSCRVAFTNAIMAEMKKFRFKSLRALNLINNKARPYRFNESEEELIDSNLAKITWPQHQLTIIHDLNHTQNEQLAVKKRLGLIKLKH